MDFLQNMHCDGQSDGRGDPFSILILLSPACTHFRMGKEDCSLGDQEIALINRILVIGQLGMLQNYIGDVRIGETVG